MPGDVHVVGPRDPRPLPTGTRNINVTSRSNTGAGKAFSPFNLGPVPLYWGLTARKMENAWQFSKVYTEHTVLHDGKWVRFTTEQWWKWALKGFNDTYAHRYPMGKGARPLYSMWKDEHLDYIEARKRIYVPLYAYCVRQIPEWAWLQEEYRAGEDIYLWDFDGYNYKAQGMTIEEVLNEPKKIMGHGHVLAMMLEAPELIPELEDPWD